MTKGIVVSLALVAALTASCTTPALRSTFNDYGEAYAEAQNHQLLMNLARLSQHHPTYFFQLGNISALYEFTGTFSAAGGEVGNAKSGIISWLFGPASVAGTRSSKPTFQFVPLSGGDFAHNMINPQPASLFNTLLHEGFPVDILMRTVVQQIRYIEYDSVVTNIDNVATTKDTTNEIVLVNSPNIENIDSYVRFLNVCYMLREFQDHGYLAERDIGQNEMILTNVAVAPTTKDITDALDKGYSWQDRGGKWVLEKKKEMSFSFEIADEGTNLFNTLKSAVTNSVKGLSPAEMATNEWINTEEQMIEHLRRSLRPSVHRSNPQVQFRSFLFLLAAMANEQTAFEKTLLTNPTFINQVPFAERRPILKMDWSQDHGRLNKSLVKVSYQDKTYQITDPNVIGQNDQRDFGDPSWNRDAFLLAATLFSQINIDPTKLNYQPQVLQVK